MLSNSIFLIHILYIYKKIHRIGFRILSEIVLLISNFEIETVKFVDICRRLKYYIICRIYFLN